MEFVERLQDGHTLVESLLMGGMSVSKHENRQKVHVAARSQEELNQTIEHLMEDQQKQSPRTEVVLLNVFPDPMDVQFDEVTKYPFGVEIGLKTADDALTDEPTM